MDLMLLFFKILIIFLAAEGVVYGIALVVITKCISISHRFSEEWTEKGKGRLDDEGKDKGSKRLPDATEEDR